jgi:hypothetical protein
MIMSVDVKERFYCCDVVHILLVDEETAQCEWKKLV